MGMEKLKQVPITSKEAEGVMFWDLGSLGGMVCSVVLGAIECFIEVGFTLSLTQVDVTVFVPACGEVFW